jgi:cation diffusion facilitator family transporter
MRWVRDYKPQPAESRLYRLALWITVGGNVFLAALKGVAAYLSGSIALYSDTANSVSDVFYSLLMILGLWMAQRPPDLTHPQGHSRFEPLVGLMVSFSMAFAGYEAGRASLERFLIGGSVIEPGLPTIVLTVSAAVKLAMFLSIRKIAALLLSPTLNTTARDHISDVLTSTAAFIGALGSSLIHPLLDPIAGLAVSLWIFRAAFNAARENLNFLTGHGADEELRKKILDTAQSVPGVLRVHHLMTDYSGPRLVIDLHINVNADTPLRDSHQIEDEVMNRLKEMPEIDRAYVHIEPHDWQE